MRFRYERVARNRIVIVATNSGWGTADCRGDIRNRLLQSLFSDEMLHFRSLIESAKEQPVVSLDLTNANSKRLAEIWRPFAAERFIFPNGASGSPVGDLEAVGRCRSIDKTDLEFKEPVTCSLSCKLLISSGKLLISEAGFELGGGDN